MFLQPAYFGDGRELGKTGAGVAGGGVPVAGGVLAAGAIGVTSAAFAEVGSLSALATKSANCHI
jgi:hypothetical protein